MKRAYPTDDNGRPGDYTVEGAGSLTLFFGRRTDSLAKIAMKMALGRSQSNGRRRPKHLPPKSTVHDYFVDWQSAGTLARLQFALYAQARELAE